MILYEFEGKKILQQAGINIPNGQLISPEDLERLPRLFEARNDIGMVLKAQVLSGKRASSGGIVMVGNKEEVEKELKKLFGKVINKEKVEQVLVEELVEHQGPEYYVSISYDTQIRGPLITLSSSGGTGVEEKKFYHWIVDPLDSENNLVGWHYVEMIPKELMTKLVNLFFEYDLTLLEINPLVKTKTGEWCALDSKIKLDDSVASRHEDWKFPPRSAPGHTPTQNEIDAKKIDEGDYRGVAGSTYFDLPGDIAVLSSGGGVSLTAMDALIKEGGKPSNFTEYSGNPPKEKVVKLTKIVLNKPNIHGLWVIGTVAANFTDIYETLSGFVEALKELKSEGIKLDMPIVIRRGGPRDKEAFEMLREIKDFNLILQSEETSIAESAKVMAEKAKEYANG